MATDQELFDQMVAAAHATTVGYKNKNWKPPPPPNTSWATFDDLAKQLDARIGVSVPIPVPPDPIPTPSAPTSSLMVVRHNPGTIANVSNLSRYSMISMTAPDRGKIASIRQQAPNAKIICYRNASFVTDYSHNPDGNAGVTIEQATANNWLLKDPSGNNMRTGRYSGSFFADIGDAAYQAQWVKNVVSWAKADGFDGVFFDDVNSDISWHLAGQAYPPKYPSRDAYVNAMGNFLSNVGPDLKNAGLMSVPNIGASWDQPQVWKPWAGYCSAAVREHFMNGSPPYRGADWTIHANVMKDVLSAARPFYGLTFGPLTDTAAQRFIRASFLLFHDPAQPSAYAWDATDTAAVDPYTTAWAWDLGKPSGAATSSGAVWTRKFEKGTITVDANSAVATIS